MKIINFGDIFEVVDDNDLLINQFLNRQDAINYIVEQTGVSNKNILEEPFYEVDEHGELNSD
tara:strand:+ start:166 stop:351 length:186 start_codon:yes stop_codon:yes gene_type:complete